ncbi:metallophosphoesterase [Halovivax gelatinilyticus]|uniref:metallophosphoesterase n=1 Tax=Halovivax gelatinilyticus TaxID=2961597 RepID=UPI0020CA96A2|nr:metallophosphoesterase [Halovivax gelatinilyticus]
MIAVFSDTHSTEGHELTGAALTAAREADTVVHAGDVKSEAALEAFQAVAGELYGVAGNVDEPGVSDRLPDERTVEADGIRLAVRHRPGSGQTALAMFGRERDADVVVFGHTHRPTLVETDDVVLLNPGSHAQPRGFRPGFATIERDGETMTIELLEPDGTTVESTEVRLDRDE